MGYPGPNEVQRLQALVPVMRELGVTEAFGIKLGPAPAPPLVPRSPGESPVVALRRKSEEMEREARRIAEVERRERDHDRVLFGATEGVGFGPEERGGSTP
jgi:hypothetical protein